MATASNPMTISQAFGLDENKLAELGVLNATVAVDTALFIDPMLLEHSSHPEMHDLAVQIYRQHFETIINLLKASKRRGDPAWKAAVRKMRFHEVPGTCLGYGSDTIRGSGFGDRLTNHVIEVADDVVGIGVEDPDLFVAMAIFEDQIGPDRISDMTTNVIFKALCEFNANVLTELGLAGEEFTLNGISGTFLRNPYENDIPVIMVPVDILRDLPVANDWDDIATAASHNSQLRDRVNENIGHIWEAQSKREKKILKSQAMSSKVAFESLLESIRAAGHSSYDVQADPLGLVKWATLGQKYAAAYPLTFTTKVITTLDDLEQVVQEIIDEFKFLIEERGLNKELYVSNDVPRHESSAQRLFFSVAHSYCKANDVDVSPEIDTGTGKIDFKFSKGYSKRVLVEIKLSTNNQTVTGYTKQLDAYKKAEKTQRAFYVVIDVGKMGTKEERLIQAKNDATKAGSPISKLEFIDGEIKPPPSKQK